MRLKERSRRFPAGSLPTGLCRWADVARDFRFYDGLVYAQPLTPLAMRLRPEVWLALSWSGAFAYGLIAWASFMHTVDVSGTAVAGTVLASSVIVLTRRHPLAAFTAALAAFYLSSASPNLGWVALAPMALALYQVSACHSVRIAAAAVVASMSGAVATALPRWQHTGGVVPFALVFLAAAATGYSVGQRRRYTRELLAHHQREAEAQIEQARHAVVEERMRIARDLHDVIAHNLSVITVQAGYGHLVADTQPNRAQAALGTIEAAGRQTLTEMRQLLGVLRADQPPELEHAPERAPAPGLANLDELIAHTTRAGVRIELTVTGTQRDLPPTVDLTAYRIMQEALTNIVKHAGVAVAEARIDYGSDELVIEVSDQGNGCRDDGRIAPGHGLLGMRERASLCRGVVNAGPLPHRGFRVTARLPVLEASE